MNDFDCLHEGKSLCTISIKNIVAFSTRTELEDGNGKTYGSHVYVADLNTPWHSFKVTSCARSVTSLEWDLPGEKLLIGTDCGQLSIWSMKDHVLNSWAPLGSSNFPGETIVGAAFFHNGRKISIVGDKKDNILYSEKMTVVKFGPSVREFGGGGGEGCLGISSTGMVCALMLTSARVLTASDSLSTTRSIVRLSDISYGKNGEFVVAVCSGEVCRVHCYRVSVRRSNNSLSLTSQALPSFFLNAFKNNRHSNSGKVEGLKFILREDADSLVVAANTDQGGILELWQLSERPVQLHRIFHNSSDPLKTVVWQYECSHTSLSPITSITTCKLALTTTTPPPSYVLVASSDSNLQCLSRDSLKLISSCSLSSAWQEDTMKHQRLNTTITDMDMSWLGCALAMVDSHSQLYVYKLPPLLEPGVGMSINVASVLLEYCLVTGGDPWDVLVSLRPPLVEATADKIVDNFNRQPLHTQQYYYVGHLALRIALARVGGCQSKAQDLSSLLMLHSVSNAFTSLLRPSDMANTDKGPQDSLASALGDSVCEVDKVLIHLEAKEFTVEPSTVQSLQQLIQWTADLALNILARLPDQYKSAQFELVRDYKAVNILRQLLLIIRVWGLLKASCLPVFVRSAENIDVLPLLFKHLSRLVQMHEPDDSLIDDCLLLPSQVMIPQMNPTTSTTSVVSPLLNSQSFPIQMEFGIEPECLVYQAEGNQMEGCLSTDQSLDTIRHIYLGKQPSTVKQCSRCGGKAQVSSWARTAAIRAWDLRWARACRCSGLWSVHKYT